MQLHACLLLFIITTDKTLACGGDVRLDKLPAGHIALSLPFTGPVTHRPGRTPAVSVCTWTISLPLGRAVLLKFVWSDVGSSVKVRCVLHEENRVVQSGGTALLSHCDGDRAAFTWTAAGRSSRGMQLSYHVQEDERNSSRDPTSPRSDQDLQRRPRTGTGFTSAAPQDAARGMDRGGGRLFEGLEGSPGPRPASGPSSQDQGSPRPTSPLQGLAAAGRADRETLPLPEEEPDNGADASGAARLADGKTSTGEGARPYFQPTDSVFHTPHTVNTENKSGDELPGTRIAAAISASTLSGTYAATRTSEPSTSTQALSSSRVPALNSSSPSRTTWESDTVRTPRDGAVSGASREELPHWRRQRGTDGLDPDPSSAVTADPPRSPTEPQQGDSHTGIEPTSPSSSSSQASSETHSTATEAASRRPSARGTDSSVSAASEVSGQTAALAFSEKLETLHTSTSSTQRSTNSPQSTEGRPLPQDTPPVDTPPADTPSPFPQTNQDETHSLATPSGIADLHDQTLTSSSSAPLTLGDVIQASAPSGTTTDPETHTLRPTYTLSHDRSPTNSPTRLPPSPSTSVPSPPPSYTLQTHTAAAGRSPLTHTPSFTTAHTPLSDRQAASSQTIRPAASRTPKPALTSPPVALTQTHNYITTQPTPPLRSLTTAESDHGGGEDVEREDETTAHTPTAGAPSRTASHPGLETRSAPGPSVSSAAWSPTTTETPTFYIVPDQPSAIRVESIELLLQIVVEDSRSAFTSGLEEDTTAWVEPYLQKAPGFSRLLGVWSSGHAVQSLVEFRTSGALRWLGMTGPGSLLERTGLARALCEGRSFRSSKITNITLGGLQADVCDWLLQCPAGYKCAFNPGTANYSCSSVCHSDYCHHRGICTHHPGQLPVCRCIVGEDFWYMGQRCDARMTRARLVGACLAVLLILVTVVGALALVAVRRYRAILIQAKVDQTRSSYRRFNHFDELSGRFWLRSWAGSADSLDNPAFTRSDELLHLRALDRPCCYHDDTLSLSSTCPSHGAHINTIYPHSSQYGWRGSELSMADGVLDSGKASDLSVCSWPVEPIQWTPFPLLQQLASHRTPKMVRVSRPRSYCEGMELVDLGKSWTA